MNPTIRLTRVAALCSGLLLAGAAFAQSTTTSPTAPAPAAASAGKSDSKLNRADAGFLKQAAQNGFMEIEGSKLAESKATSDKVKAFAKQMIDDHTKMGEEVKTLATAKGITDLPTEPSIAQRGALKLLSTADGGNFDRRYADVVGVKAHEDTVKMFEKASKNAKDPEVKALAAKALPHLQEHLKMARELRDTTRAEKKAKDQKA